MCDSFLRYGHSSCKLCSFIFGPPCVTLLHVTFTRASPVHRLNMGWQAALGWAVVVSGVAHGFKPKDSMHCVQWGPAPATGPTNIRAEATHGNPAHPAPVLCRPDRNTAKERYAPNDATVHPSGAVCAGPTPECGSTPVGRASAHLDVGTVEEDGTCVPISAGRNATRAEQGETLPATDFMYAVIDPTCEVWWREVSADVIPPIPELVLVFGTTSDGHKMGLCRSFGDDVSVDDGQRIVGTLATEGPDFGRCFITRADGTTTAIDGGLFHVLQARAAQPSCEDNAQQQAELKQGLSERVAAYVTADDQALIAKVAGHPFATLLSATLELGSCDLAQLLSPARFVPHPLNTQGLHLLRCVLAERMAEQRAIARGYHTHPDYPTWRQDGLIVKNWDTMTDDDLHALLQMVSGEETLAIPQPPYEWVPRHVPVETTRDPQNDMHVDTFAQIVKVWIFQQGVTMEQGPLHYFKGSNRNDEGKLRWMYRYGLPPATEAMIEPSFRLLGCLDAVDAAPDYIARALLERVPLLPLAEANATLVIADTSGLHNRGMGVPGHTRRSLRLAGDTDGGLKRLDPFRPIPVL
eukprot:m.159559 g.159559  ORF g.159559 m.159559 type:complete len:580 (-) comp11810_c0_seq1:70-1809(-)